jgi:hypothetical protein
VWLSPLRDNGAAHNRLCLSLHRVSEAIRLCVRYGGGHPPREFPHHEGHAGDVWPQDQPDQDDGVLVLPCLRHEALPRPRRCCLYRNIKPGTLDDPTLLVPTIHFWTRSAQKWILIPEDAVRYETQPETLSWTTPAS